MRDSLKVLILLALVALVAGPVAAKDGPKKKSRKRGQYSPAAQMAKQLKTIELNADQKETIQAILKECGPNLAELQAAFKLSPEQRKAMAEARKAAMADGTKGKQLQELITKAGDLTPDQVEARAKLQKFVREVRGKIAAVLTPEQRKAAKFGGGHHGPKKGRKGDKKN